jgi:hypothetical protein
MTDDRLQELYNIYLGFTNGMVEEYGAMEVAAIMMAQAMSLYKTGLDEIDYNKIIDNISARRSQVQKFTPSILQ